MRSLRIWTQDIITWKIQKNQQKIEKKMDWKRPKFQALSLGQGWGKLAMFFLKIKCEVIGDWTHDLTKWKLHQSFIGKMKGKNRCGGGDWTHYLNGWES